jgi:hypothetical protein
MWSSQGHTDCTCRYRQARMPKQRWSRRGAAPSAACGMLHFPVACCPVAFWPPARTDSPLCSLTATYRAPYMILAMYLGTIQPAYTHARWPHQAASQRTHASAPQPRPEATNPAQTELAHAHAGRGPTSHGRCARGCANARHGVMRMLIDACKRGPLGGGGVRWGAAADGMARRVALRLPGLADGVQSGNPASPGLAGGVQSGNPASPGLADGVRPQSA